MISLKQLRYFDAVARLRHFGNAASHCAVSQPALSMQIRELENELGLLLLERHPRGVRLTREGREIAERAGRILSEVHNLRDYARHGNALLTGTLRLGIIPSIAPYLLPPMLPKLRGAYPHLELNIRETQTEHLLSELLEGTLDVLVLAMPVEHPEITTLDLFEDRFRLALPPDRKRPDRVRATPEILNSGRLLLLEEGHCLRDQALAICQLRKTDYIDTFGASSLSTLVQMVANGMGMTLLPEISLAVEASHHDVHLMRFAPPEPRRVVGLAWRASSPRSRDFAELGKLARNVVPKNRRL
jgi:LysR family transcriptional regulator, hydrogen peroxide-inducible genes activator